MSADNQYLLTTLPILGRLESAPPLNGRRLLDLAEGLPAAELLAAILLEDDLMLWQQGQAGQAELPEPTVLEVAQLEGRAALPDYLALPDDVPSPSLLVTDRLWQAYFRYLHQLGESRGSELLAQYAISELALRNRLAAWRAGRLRLEVSQYQIPELDEAAAQQLSDSLDKLIAAWQSQVDPVEAARVLDGWRWDWIAERDGWYSFGDDELVAYALRLRLIERWQRLATVAVVGGVG
jgi:hypothetical protein